MTVWDEINERLGDKKKPMYNLPVQKIQIYALRDADYDTVVMEVGGSNQPDRTFRVQTVVMRDKSEKPGMAGRKLANVVTSRIPIIIHTDKKLVIWQITMPS
jgi:hypothetical protein